MKCPVAHHAPTANRHALADLNIRFPAVVKPASRHSSSGVLSYSSMEVLQDGIEGYPAYETILIEDRVIGQEFSVEDLVQAGDIVFDSVTRKESTESAGIPCVDLRRASPTVSPPAF